MNKTLTAIGRAALYFLIYSAVQIAVSTITSTIVSAQIAAEAMTKGIETDYADAYSRTLERLAELSSVMVLISAAAVLILYWLILLVQGRSLFAEVSVGRMKKNGIFPVLLLGAAFELLISLSLQVLPYPQRWMDSWLQHADSPLSGNPLVNGLAVVLAAPAAEETVFRGFIYSRLKCGMPPLAAAAAVSLLFAAMHGTIIQGIYMFFAGMFFIWVFEQFQSLSASILFHASFNLTGMLLPFLPAANDAAVLFGMPAAATVCAGTAFWIKRSSTAGNLQNQCCRSLTDR